MCNHFGKGKKFQSIRKLLLHQFDKENYVVHYSVLKYYLFLGAEMKKLHAGIKYSQKPWLKSYIDFNSIKRRESKTDFEKSYYKLRNNAIFGKSMENVRKRRDIKLVNNSDSLMKLTATPLYVQHFIVDEDLVALELYKSKVTLNKLIYVGQTVLDYSKLEMYELYYDVINKCPLIDKVRLCGGDTDSFFLCLYTSPNITLNDVFSAFRDKFDSSNYDEKHPLFSNVNKARLGCFKDECAGRLLEEFILLKPKMYSMKYLNDDKSVKRAKGIQKAIVSSFDHVDYQNIYYSSMQSVETMTLIQSRKHQLSTVNIKKRGLSLWEDKRCWLEKNYSLPYGHHSLSLPPPSKRTRLLPKCGDVNE